MNTKSKFGMSMMALVFGLMLSPALSNQALADQPDLDLFIKGDLTAPNGDKPFGSDIVGKYSISVRDDRTTINTTFNTLPTPGTVYEGWLVDVDTGEKTSFGILNDNTQRNTSHLLSTVMTDFNYDLIVITEEPLHDVDPAPHTPVGGAVLAKSFGQ